VRARMTHRSTTRRAGRRRRAAFTTIELVVALTLGGLVAAAVASVLRRQQRFLTTASVLVEQRVSLRDATGILPGELRSLAPGADVLAFSDSSIDFRATIAAAIACDTVAGGAAIDLAPVRRTGAPQLASFTVSPQPGDVALVYDERQPADSTDDAWISLDVTDVTSAPTACAASPLLTAADAGVPRARLRFAS